MIPGNSLDQIDDVHLGLALAELADGRAEDGDGLALGLIERLQGLGVKGLVRGHGLLSDSFRAALGWQV